MTMALSSSDNSALQYSAMGSHNLRDDWNHWHDRVLITYDLVTGQHGCYPRSDFA